MHTHVFKYTGRGQPNGPFVLFPNVYIRLFYRGVVQEIARRKTSNHPLGERASERDLKVACVNNNWVARSRSWRRDTIVAVIVVCSNNQSLKRQVSPTDSLISETQRTTVSKNEKDRPVPRFSFSCCRDQKWNQTVNVTSTQHETRKQALRVLPPRDRRH